MCIRDSSLAVCNAAALGTALAMLAAGAFAGGDIELLKRPKFYTGMAIVLAVAASLTVRAGDAGRTPDFRRAAVWVALAGGTAGLVAISRVQMSTIDVWALVSSDAIRAEKSAVGDLMVASAIAVFGALLAVRRLAPLGAPAPGFDWRAAALSICAGIVIGYSVRLVGAFFAAAMLLAPPLMAVRLCGRQPAALAASSAAGLAAVSIGMLLAFRHNLSPGRAAGVAACFIAAGAWGIASAAGAVLARILPSPAGPGSPDRTGPAAPAGVPAGTARRFRAAALGISACASLGLMAWIAGPYFEGLDIFSSGRAPIESYRPVFVEGAEDQWPHFRGPQCIGLAPLGRWPVAWSRKGGGREGTVERGEDGPAGKEKGGGGRNGILWEMEVPLPGYSSPIVWGKRVFCTGAGGESRELFCFDADGGQLLWRRIVGAAGKAGGEEPQSGWAAPTPATDGKRVLAVFPTGFAAAFDFEGNEIWARNLGRLGSRYGYASSPVAWKDRFILQLDVEAGGGSRPRLMALDAATGNVLWERERKEGESWSSPALVRTDRGDLIVTCAAPWVAACRPEDGVEVWRASVLGGDVVPSAVFADGMALVCNDQSRLAAVRLNGTGDVTGSAVVWTRESHDLPDTASPVTDGEYVYLFSAGGVASCWEVASGKAVWSYQFDTGFCASPVLTADGTIYAWDTAGAC
ncbi:MAG: PQQ-like beta-propeller repeat protein, partial [Planctomycetota bacterium]|nr:PQQ-like beta-propeller repeat protein [Planctomycetota bacterium]